MQNILILGASSQIGQELTLHFAPKNSLTIVGRNQESLQFLQAQCLESGAENVDLIVQDIADGADSLIQKLGDRQFDLVINLVAGTSRVKDSEFLPSQLEGYLMSDLLVPVQLFQKLIERSSKPLKMIFISSILAAVRSPDRLLYSSLKSMQELCLQKLSTCRQGVELLVVKVAKVLPHGHSSRATQELANAVYEAHLLNKKTLNYGWGGRVYLILFYTQPIVFSLIVKSQRVLRACFARP